MNHGKTQQRRVYTILRDTSRDYKPQNKFDDNVSTHSQNNNMKYSNDRNGFRTSHDNGR